MGRKSSIGQQSDAQDDASDSKQPHGGERQEDLKSIDLNMLVRRTANGFCGADIESVVHDAIEQVFLEGRPRLETQDLLNAIEKTHPIGETMHAALEEMESKRDENKFTSASA